MVDVFAVAGVIVKQIEVRYPEDIAIVGYYGSYLQGRATERSDLDFFFIPSTERGRQAELQFLIGGISFDFYPISWERAERMARFEDWNTTIIADCELLYVRSEEDRTRFMRLRDTIADMKHPSKMPAMMNKAELALRECFAGLDRFRLAGLRLDLSYCRTIGQDIAGHLFRCLGYLNQTYYTRSWGHYREQVRKLPLSPDTLESCLDTIMFSRSADEIRSACERVTLDTHRLISERREGLEGRRSYADRLKGYYEEERGMLNKLLTACETGQYETAFFVAVGVQDDLSRMLYAAERGYGPGFLGTGEYRDYYTKFGYPDLVSLLDPNDFEPLRLAVLRLIERLEKHLSSEGVPLNRFDSVAEFEAFYSLPR
ncbi:nucleotidyltransferase domain-containing protein [Paenibacillus ginsengarvi]|uniref:Nucleotidyltransferase domain-containing protein n=1 Tax=Paenibacillus ginsengarvi TaxID=400777 RepID=A0A3B0CGD8_9BACL|nr:nucleotidyltransferase domain-containing protein [Paenibacillus ginsengarvi]RKN83938.1 nucleotidyltransferase domain-containing protein [Paenibacillus ginsengarvi]